MTFICINTKDNIISSLSPFTTLLLGQLWPFLVSVLPYFSRETKQRVVVRSSGSIAAQCWRAAEQRDHGVMTSATYGRLAVRARSSKSAIVFVQDHYLSAPHSNADRCGLPTQAYVEAAAVAAAGWYAVDRHVRPHRRHNRRDLFHWNLCVHVWCTGQSRVSGLFRKSGCG